MEQNYVTVTLCILCGVVVLLVHVLGGCDLLT